MAHDKQLILRVAAELALDKPEITLPEISEILAIERHTIERAVRAKTRLSFRAWRCAILMRSAADNILKNSDTRTKKLALSLGYASTTAFSRSFKKCFGMPPTAYRRLARASKVQNLPEMPVFPSTNAHEFLLRSSGSQGEISADSVAKVPEKTGSRR